jgi:hypothetical protein
VKLIIDLEFTIDINKSSQKDLASILIDNLQHFINIDDCLFSDVGFSDSDVKVINYQIVK